jgi:hypothetical protein
MDKLEEFCKYITQRSNEHKKAVSRIRDLPGIVASILRQELDSMVRVIYLLSISDLTERNRLMEQTIYGKKWTIETKNRKQREITDREMVELSNQLQGLAK